jgi:toluene monooxygenase system protein D
MGIMMTDAAKPVAGQPAKGLSAGPLLRSGEVTDALIDALKEDNADKELTIADHGGYIRVEGPGGLVLNRSTAEQMLGRAFSMQELEIYMTGFSGKIYTTTESVRWFFKQAT